MSMHLGHFTAIYSVDSIRQQSCFKALPHISFAYTLGFIWRQNTFLKVELQTLKKINLVFTIIQRFKGPQKLHLYTKACNYHRPFSC